MGYSGCRLKAAAKIAMICRWQTSALVDSGAASSLAEPEVVNL